MSNILTVLTITTVQITDFTLCQMYFDQYSRQNSKKISDFVVIVRCQKYFDTSNIKIGKNFPTTFRIVKITDFSFYYDT